MNEPQPGDFFLAPITGIGGFGIRVGEWLNGDGFLKVQHAGVYIGAGITVEAYPGGAIYGLLNRYKLQALVWSTDLIDLTPEQRLKVIRGAEKMQGVPYSGLDYLAIAAHRFHLPIPHLKAYIANTGHMICSQLVDQVYLDAGVHLFADSRWPGYVTPGALYRLLDNARNYRLSQGI